MTKGNWVECRNCGLYFRRGLGVRVVTLIGKQKRIATCCPDCGNEIEVRLEKKC